MQDLGLNLYTSLPKVLVEFVANAYDADSPSVDIQMNFADIEYQRKLVKAELEKEKQQAAGNPAKLVAIVPLTQRVLPPNVTVKIVDRGCGMSREDLANQFLIAGRRRRDDGGSTKTLGGRLLMGRKGVGKLAGFGVAHKVTVTTRKKGEPHATRIVLDFNEIGKQRTTNDVVIPDEKIPDGAGLPGTGGTEIVLSDLLHEALRSQKETIERELADHFWLVAASGFQIKLNGQPIPNKNITYRYAWPSPATKADELITASITTEDGLTYPFKYRLRFRVKSLTAQERGVRVYAHGRLASAPDLLDVETGMHGFRQIDYLDGVVEADFIDDQPIDYVATNRQSLRWNTPLLTPLREFLSAEMKTALQAYQKDRDEAAQKDAEEDIFTNDLIQKAMLPKHRAKVVHKMAATLASVCKDGTTGQEYKDRVKILVSGIEQGDILEELRKLALQNLPNFSKVVEEVTELTKQEFGDFGRYLRGRLSGIESIKKTVSSVDFKAKRNEKQIQELFEKCSWLVDPTYTQFLLASDVSLDTVYKRLAQELNIGSFARTKDQKEPDLVFLLGNDQLRKIVIVELKASNIELEAEHLTQLEYYMERADQWLQEQNQTGFTVHGHLIGTKASPSARSQGVVVLRKRIKESGPDTLWKVRDYLEVVSDAEAAHHELLTIQRQLINASKTQNKP
ncbi:MAG: ATP-binding protein [Gemmataceae bacterium]